MKKLVRIVCIFAYLLACLALFVSVEEVLDLINSGRGYMEEKLKIINDKKLEEAFTEAFTKLVEDKSKSRLRVGHIQTRNRRSSK